MISDRFEVQEPAGSGGMGLVYRGRDRHTGEDVALKLLDVFSDAAAERFAREALVLADLAHPAIVRYVAHGALASGERWLAMAWLDGPDLGKRLATGVLDADLALVLGRRVADALAAAHARGIVHRDVKPSNVVLVGGRVEGATLIDFGLARLGRGASLTREGEVLGTVGFMAPEQVRGVGDLDARVDVFALGCLIYACVNGHGPFAGGDTLAICTRILHDDPPAEGMARLSPELAGLVGRMLAKDRGRRPAGGAAAAALLAELDQQPALGARERRMVSVLVSSDGAFPVSGDALATDLAARGARWALNLGHAALVSGWDEIELAARGRALLGDGPGVFVDDVTAGLLGDRFDLRGSPRGLELRGERPLEAPRVLLGKETPFVGREHELATLEDAFAAAVDGEARAVLVTAPAGLGKSRLRREAVARLGRRAEIWIGRADEVRAGSAFALIGAALRQAAGVRDDDPATARRKLRARAGRHLGAGDADRVAGFLGELAGVPFPDADSPFLRAARQDRALLGDQLRMAWEELLRAETAAGPLVLIFEDLQWGDAPSVQLVDVALRALADAPLLVMGFARPEVHDLFPRLWSTSGGTEIRLRPLGRKASERLVGEILGERATPETVVAVAEKAGGNVFFLEELIRAVAEGRTDAPDTVLAMLQARLDALPLEARRVLRAASVFGEELRRAGVMALAGEGAGEWLELLVARELLALRRGRGDELRFQHGLVREAAYGTLTVDDRRAAHLAAGDWLERSGERDELLLAGHFERGEALDRAARHWQLAAEQALDAGDLEGVLRRIERGLACGGERGPLRLVECLARADRTEFALARAAAAEAAALFPAGSRQALVAATEEAVVAARLGEHAPILRLAAGVATEAAPAPVLARLVANLASYGHVAAARALQARLPPVDDAGGEPLVAAAVHHAHAQVAHATGARTAAVEHFAATVECFQRAGNQRAAAYHQANLGMALTELGELDRAEAVLADTLATGERRGLAIVVADTLHNLGWVRLERGALEPAAEALRRALARYVANGARRMEGSARSGLARVALASGRTAEATAEIELAVETTRAAPSNHALALALRARIRMAAGDRAGALEDARAALALPGKLGALAMIARVLHSLGLDAEARPIVARGLASMRETAAESPAFLEKEECRTLLELARIG